MEIYVSLKISKMVAKVVKILFGHILWEQKAKKKKKKSHEHMLHGKVFSPAQCQMSWPYELPFPHKLIFSLGFHIWTYCDSQGYLPKLYAKRIGRMRYRFLIN